MAVSTRKDVVGALSDPSCSEKYHQESCRDIDSCLPFTLQEFCLISVITLSVIWTARGCRTGSKGRRLIELSVAKIYLSKGKGFSLHLIQFWTQHDQFSKDTPQNAVLCTFLRIGMLICEQLIDDLLTLSYLLCWTAIRSNCWPCSPFTFAASYLPTSQILISADWTAPPWPRGQILRKCGRHQDEQSQDC